MALPSTDDLGFCSSEDYLENELHSPTDSSEDSVEVKICPISLVNKRKRIEPQKAITTFNGPLKKRMCLKVKAESNESHPFRPWSPHSDKCATTIKTEEILPVLCPKSMDETKKDIHFTTYCPEHSTIKFCQQSEPVALLNKCKKKDKIKIEMDVITYKDIRVPVHPQLQNMSVDETERVIMKSAEVFPTLQTNIDSNTSTSFSNKKSDCHRREQRNYKNMTRERRIEANARERTRVHTISAAFDTLRRSVPSYSHNQKLSKLSVLRIACSYIMTLSSIVRADINSIPSTSECVDMVSRTIQREGKLRKKKDDND